MNIHNNPRKILKTSLVQSNIINYFKTDLEFSTKKCTEILANEPYGEKEAMSQNWNRNIYCPYHETKGKSKTPSARLNIKKHFIHCFSKYCNKNVSTDKLLKFLLSKKKKE